MLYRTDCFSPSLISLGLSLHIIKHFQAGCGFGNSQI